MTEYTMYRVQKTVDKLISNEKLFNKYSTVTKKNNSPDFSQDCPCSTTYDSAANETTKG